MVAVWNVPEHLLEGVWAKTNEYYEEQPGVVDRDQGCVTLSKSKPHNLGVLLSNMWRLDKIISKTPSIAKISWLKINPKEAKVPKWPKCLSLRSLYH